MINSVLVPIDSSAHAHAALEHALELGRAYRSRIAGLYVLDIRYLEMPPYLDYSYAFEAVPPTFAALDVMEKFRIKSEHLLNDVRESVERAGLSAETRTEEGVPSQVIADVGGAYDLIAMGKRGEHAKWGRDLLGSTAENVVRRSATPVLLAESTSRPMNKALVLFDGSHSANRALKLAADLALHTGVELKILTADDDAVRGRVTQEEARSYLGPLSLQATYALMPGRAVKAAIGVLDHDPADIVVLGMRGHSALHHLILGSTAEQLMRSVELPVLLAP
jgi:nucleotide-binding universal stress UspA family protein